jgi:ankyrin repeat protein
VRGLRTKFVSALGLAVLLSASTAPAPPDVAQAAKRGDREAVRALLQQGADVNMAEGDGMTALHWAAERGDGEMAAMLLYAGASTKAVTRIGQYTPLHLASKSGSAPVVEMLLKGGSDVKAITTNSGATALHFAAAAGSAEAVTSLLNAGADINARDLYWEQTPLMYAASLNRADAIRVLMGKGADHRAKSHAGLSDGRLNAANNAQRARQTELLNALQANGATPTPSQVQAAIEAGRAARLTATGTAVAETQQNERRDPDEPPIQAGTTTRPGGMTALLHAARQGHVQAVKALIDGGADVNQTGMEDDTTPLNIAAINSQWDVVVLLVQNGADPNIQSNITGAAPLWSIINAQWQPRTRFPQPQEGWYQQASYLDAMEALLKGGADPDALTERQPNYTQYSGCGNGNCGLTNLGGTTAFWRAAHGADVDAMRLLASYGADPRVARAENQGGGGGGGGGGRGGPPQAAGGRGGQGGGRGGPPGGGGGRAGGDQPEAPPVPLVPVGPALAIHAAAGLGFGQGVGAGNANRFMENGWVPSLKFLIEELGMDVNSRDVGGFTPLHFAAARGDHAAIEYLMSKGADIKARSRPQGGFPNGFTVADMANGPQPRITPMPATVELLRSLGSEFTNNCRSC